MHVITQATLFEPYLIVRGDPFPSAFQVSPTWRTHCCLRCHSGVLSSPALSFLSHHALNKLCSYNFVPPHLFFFSCKGSLLPLQIVDGCYAAFHCRSTLCHPSSHLYAGVNRDISEQLLLPLCPGSERTATPRPSRIEEGNFPGPPCSDSHTHVCMSPQLVSILPVLFACLAQGVAPRIFCSPCLSSRGKVGHSDPVYC